MTGTPGTGSSAKWAGGWKRLEEWLRAVYSGKWAFPAGLIVVVLALLSGIATYAINSNLTPIFPSGEVYYATLSVNIVLIVALMSITAYQVFELWRERRRQAAGAGLHVRIVGLFTLVAVIPAIILAAFAANSLDQVLNRLFSDRVTAVVNNSVDVALSYVKDHGQIVRSELINLGAQLEASPKLMEENPEAFKMMFDAKAKALNLPVAYLINRQGQHLAEYGDKASFAQGAPPHQAFLAADVGKVAILPPEYTGGVGALKKLENYNNVYLYVIRSIRPEVLHHLDKAQENLANFDRLRAERDNVQFQFALMYGSVTFTLLLASVWFGLWFAKWLVAPITALIGAAEQVSEGNLDVEVDAGGAQRGDLGQLGATFNTMTADLRRQRHQLVSANAELEERRRFIEAVLSGVTAGVFGLDADGEIRLANNSAIEMLGLADAHLAGRRLADVVPEFGPLLEKLAGRKAEPQHITLMRQGKEHIFAVRVMREREDKRGYGLVVTFDDITDLVVAQRTSAWADIARRIAHEIKNPLTPIQLSAERLRRKYADSITTDREIFDRCTDTIIRHVGDIGRMVDEFSSFARMPNAVMEDHNVIDLVREAVILFQMSHSENDYTMELPDSPLIVQCDRRLITQAVTNLVKNAGEAITTHRQNLGDEKYRGRITARVKEQGGRMLIEVIDNGCGLPKENRHRLVEPYVTTRAKGTGLGLAIVQRITEQHGGTLELQDAGEDAGGALVRLSLPLPRGAEVVELHNLEDKNSGQEPRIAGKRRAKREKGATHGV